MGKEKLVEKKPMSARMAQLNLSRDPVYTDPEKAPYPDMRWSKYKKRWCFIDRRTPAEKKLAREAKRKEQMLLRIWDPVLRRIPQGWYHGISCNLGWKDIIFKLVAQLDWVWEGFDGNKWKPEECWLPVQVKEKFGTLRFYTWPGVKVSKKDSKKVVKDYDMRWEISHILISEAEHKTASVCEECGERGERRVVGGWILTSCQPCYDARLKDLVTRELKGKDKKGYAKLEARLMDDVEQKRRKDHARKRTS